MATSYPADYDKERRPHIFQTSLRDIIGVETEIWMNETSALALARTQDKMAFVKAWEEGDQLFPIMATVKILRSTKAMTSDSQADTQEVSQSTACRQAYINYLIVDASDQPLHEPPTTATLPSPTKPSLKENGGSSHSFFVFRVSFHNKVQ